MTSKEIRLEIFPEDEENFEHILFDNRAVLVRDEEGWFVSGLISKVNVGELIQALEEKDPELLAKCISCILEHL